MPTPQPLESYVQEELTALALHLAAPSPSRPHFFTLLQGAQKALHAEGSGLEWFQAEFKRLSKQGEMAHMISPHSLDVALERGLVALAIGPANQGRESATRFYCISDGRLFACTPLDADETTLFQRLVLVLSWGAEDRIQPVAAACLREIEKQLLRDISNQAQQHESAHVRLLANTIAERPTTTLLDIIVAYLALGKNPAAQIAAILKNLTLPLPNTDER